MGMEEMSDEDRAELFLVLGDVREEIRDLRGASRTLRRVVVPREEHRMRRRFTMALCALSVIAAMNLNFFHSQVCVPPHAYPAPGSARAFACDTLYPGFSHAYIDQGPPVEHWAPIGHWPAPGNLLGLLLYAALVLYTVLTFKKVRGMTQDLAP